MWKIHSTVYYSNTQSEMSNSDGGAVADGEGWLTNGYATRNVAENGPGI